MFEPTLKTLSKPIAKPIGVPQGATETVTGGTKPTNAAKAVVGYAEHVVTSAITRVVEAVTAPALVVVVFVTAAFVTGCAEEEPPPPPHTRVKAVVDFSDSALDTGGSDLNAAARNAVAEALNSASVNTTIEVHGFTNRPGQECDPITLDLVPQDNPESDKQLRENLTDQLPGLWDQYRDCLRDENTGMAQAGSGIFGAAVVAATTNTEDLSAVTVYTDGCTFRELAPAPETCSAGLLADPAGPQTLINQMPAALKPPINVPVTFAYVGRGTELSAPQLLALRSTFTLWGAATGAPVTFQD